MKTTKKRSLEQRVIDLECAVESMGNTVTAHHRWLREEDKRLDAIEKLPETPPAEKKNNRYVVHCNHEANQARVVELGEQIAKHNVFIGGDYRERAEQYADWLNTKND